VDKVEKGQRPEGILERAAEALDLPGDVVAGLPRLEITGFKQLRMENHQGIVTYSTEEIRVSGGRSEVCVRGSGLTLRAMNSRELLITGQLRQLEFVD
jgi:sporulation protein YqfC